MVRATEQLDLDSFVESLEAAHHAGVEVRFGDFVPKESHPEFCEIATELIRVDLEYRWQRGCALPLDSYKKIVSPVFNNRLALSEIAFEEFRLRKQKEPSLSPEEYQRRFGINTDFWPTVTPSGNALHGASDKNNESTIDEDLLQRVLPDAEEWIDSLTEFPEVGSQFAGFELLEELGRGSFGRVFLAKQQSLANRNVVLKVTPRFSIEPEYMARLQHTNIVPVYSVHEYGILHGICMPFFGRHTLSDYKPVFQNRENHKPAANDTAEEALLDTKRLQHNKTVTPSAARSEQEIQPQATATADAVAEPYSEVNTQSQLACKISTVATIVRDIAAGLSHAHARGIIHRDIKPANILLTDDRVPMLLDFNLSEDEKPIRPVGVVVGGTLPYMSPSHLRAVRAADGADRVEATDDVYSLGVILFELLTGKRPFPVRRGAFLEVIEKMLLDRSASVPSPRSENPEIPHDLDSIVRKSLSPDPNEGYASARELYEDLDAHLSDMPLPHADDSSLPLRMAKWTRRHPKLSSAASVMTLLGTLLIVGAFALFARGSRIDRLEAKQGFESFQTNAKDAKLLLAVPDADANATREGVAHAESTLEQYHFAQSDQGVSIAKPFSLLPISDQETVRKETSELLYLLADEKLRQAALHKPSAQTAKPNEPSAFLKQAAAFNRLALATYEKGPSSKALLLQRADVLEETGYKKDAASVRTQAFAMPLREAEDYYLAARMAFNAKKWNQALGHLSKAIEKEPRNPAYWFAKANTHLGLKQLAEAESAFTVCIGLAPKHYLAYLLRGLQRLEAKEYAAAQSDFDHVLALRPDRVDAYVDRALAFQGMQQYAKAEKDFTRAIDLGFPETRVYKLRSIVRKKLGDSQGAADDFKKFFALKPIDERSWLSRGMSKLSSDTQGAFSDFEAALKLNPRSINALRNIAYVQGEKLNAPQRAIATLTRIVALDPSNAFAIAGRGVFHARLNHREKALADAQKALSLSRQPKTLLQVASIYAILSKTNDQADKAKLTKKALAHLTQAIRLEPRLAKYVRHDQDLSALQNSKEFGEILKALELLQAMEAP